MIIYAPDAQKDVRRLYCWLLERNSTAARRWLADLDAALVQIAAGPSAWPLTSKGDARKYFMKFGRSQYTIHYLERGDDQVIQRVWHGREQRPV
jgi:plasmid stabilization system protein ParE